MKLLTKVLYSFRRYFLRGLLYIAPLLITAYIIYKLFLGLYSLSPWKSVWSFIYTLLVIIGLITLVGYLGSGILNRVFLSTEKLFERTPIIKLIYPALKDLFDAFSAEKKKFNNPVLVKVNEHPPMYRMGFITQSDVPEIGKEKHLIAVYFPLSYALTGELLFVYAENIEPLPHIKAADAMKFIISGGVSGIERHE